MTAAGDIPVHVLPDVPFLASDKSPVFGAHDASHRINFFALVWFSETRGVHYIDFERYPIRQNSVYLIGRHQVHSIPDSKVPSARVMVFSSDFFERIEEPYLRQMFLPFRNDGIAIPPGMVAPLTQLFELILLEYRTAADPALLLKYATAMLLHLYRLEQPRYPLQDGDDSRIIRLFPLLNEHYKEQHGAAFYAANIGLTPKRINEILREKMGTTISKLLYQRLVMEAKRELFHNERTIKEIAYELGFSEQSYFARFFKKYTQLTPEQFRTQSLAAFGGNRRRSSKALAMFK